jgi:hypothetical protein
MGRKMAKPGMQRKTASDHLDRVWLAMGLARNGKPEEAAENALWFWEHGRDADPVSAAAARHSQLRLLLSRLMPEVPSLRNRLEVLRDEAEKEVDARDFLTLNTILGEPERTLAWFDRVKNRKEPPGGKSHYARYVILELLVKHDRWADLLHVYRDPVEELERHLKLEREVAQEVRRFPAASAGLKQKLKRERRELAARLLRACRAAGRESDATVIKARALEVDGSKTMKRALAARS